MSILKYVTAALSSDALRNAALILIAIALWASLLKSAPDLGVYGVGIKVQYISDRLRELEATMGKIDDHLNRISDILLEQTYRR